MDPFTQSRPLSGHLAVELTLNRPHRLCLIRCLTGRRVMNGGTSTQSRPRLLRTKVARGELDRIGAAIAVRASGHLGMS
jgi:hypothetical protein